MAADQVRVCTLHLCVELWQGRADIQGWPGKACLDLHIPGQCGWFGIWRSIFADLRLFSFALCMYGCDNPQYW